MSETSVRLTDEELARLDGQVRPEIQREVDAAKARIEAVATINLRPALAAFVADVVSEAERKGELVYWNKRVRSCALCDWGGEYVRFKSGPRKGTPNRAKPVVRLGKELARRFITIDGHVTLGGCAACVEEALPALCDHLAEVRAQVPGALAVEGRPAWRRYNRKRCTKCGWEGHEGQMGQLPTLLGDGSYPGQCPSCGVKQMALGRVVFDLLDGFDVVADV